MTDETTKTRDVHQAAARAGVSEDYMRRLFRCNLVEATNHGGSIGYLTTDECVDAWIASGMPKPPPRGQEPVSTDGVAIVDVGEDF